MKKIECLFGLSGCAIQDNTTLAYFLDKLRSRFAGASLYLARDNEKSVVLRLQDNEIQAILLILNELRESL